MAKVKSTAKTVSNFTFNIFLLFKHEPTRTKLTFASIFYPKTSNFIIIQGFRRLSDYFKQQVRGG